MKTPFSISESIRFGWEKTRSHSGLIFKVILTLFAAQIAHSIISSTLMPSLEGIFAMIVLTVVSVVLGTGAMVITLKIARGQHANYSDIVPPLELVVRYFFASLLAGIVIVLGFILLIIPGIYLLLRYSMVRFAAIDGKGIIESLKESGKLTHGVKWNLLGFFLVLIALNILGAIPLFLGLLITLPVTAIAYAHVYNKLLVR